MDTMLRQVPHQKAKNSTSCGRPAASLTVVGSVASNSVLIGFFVGAAAGASVGAALPVAVSDTVGDLLGAVVAADGAGGATCDDVAGAHATSINPTNSSQINRCPISPP
jgi:hypothetical protein